MKNRVLILSIIFTLFISWLPVQSSQAARCDNLGIANDFNVFVFGNHTQMSSDSEGRVAVGKRAEYTNYGIGDKLTPSAAGRNDLIVGEELYAEGGTNFNGNTVIGVNGTIEKYTMTNNNGQKEPLREDVSGLFADAKADLINKTSKWSQLTPNGTFENRYSTLTLKGDHPELNIFTLKTEDFQGVSLFKLIVPEDATVLINVLGTDLRLSGFALKKGDQDFSPSDGGRILWNFPELINFDLSNIGMVGSILAPYATLAPTGSGQLNGTLIVENFIHSQHGGIETHHYPFNAKLPMEDEEDEPIKDPKGSIQFTKVEKGTNKKLEGAIFRLYVDKECTKEADHADVQSSEDGIVTFKELSYGTYYVKEIKAPMGYQLSSEIREVTVDKKVVDAGTFDNEYDSIIIEEPKGSIQFTKVEKGTDKPLEGATFRLYMDKECTKEADHADVKSSEDGIVTFKELSYGTYYVKEIAAPEGYQLSTEIREVIVDKDDNEVDAGTFENELIFEDPKGSIQFTKVEKGTDKKLEGATFRLYMDKECTKEAGHADVQSDKDGIVSFTDLSYGTYYVKEVTAPKGYELSTEVREVIVDKEVVDAGTFDNELIIVEEPKGSIQFTKVEKGTNKKLEGATFRLYMDKECTKEAGHADVQSDKDGMVSFMDLPYGTYYVKEVAAPEGYELSTEIREVTVDGEVVDAGTFDNELIIVEEPKGSIQFTKIEKGTGKQLEGATFRLYVDKECTKEAGHADVQSDKDGMVSFMDLPYGTYYVKEVAAPEGYQLSTEVRKVTVDKEVVDAGTFDNELIIVEEPKGSIQFMKVEKGTNKKLEGATFRLYVDKECTKEAGYADVQSDKDGMVSFMDLPYGTYYVKEVAAPEGYQLSTEVREVTVDKEVVDAGTFDNELIIVEEPKGSIQFTKIEKGTGKQLEGATFRLYVDKECTKEADHADVKSDKDGIVSFTELSYGTYYVKEIAAPKGYQLSTEVREVTVDKEVVDAGTFDNELIIVEEPKGSIQFTKVEKGTNKKLEGAIFRLYVDKECTKEAGHADVKSNEDGIVSFTDLPYGTYYVKEIVAPEGYQLSTEIRKVTVDKEKVDEKRFDNVPIKDETELGSIKIMKIDSKNKEVLEGAEFALYQGERFISTGKTDKHGIVTFEKLPYGTYYIKETKAPEGYQLSDAVITIEVNGNQTVEIEFENHLIEKEVITDSPEDDSSNIQVLVPEEPLASNPAGGVTEDSEDHNKTNIDVIDRLPQTGDTSSRILITLGIVLIMAGILLLTKRAKR